MDHFRGIASIRAGFEGHRVDAVVTGSGTFLKDNPQLTDRTELPRRRPLLRVILDRRVRVDQAPDFLIFQDSLGALAEEFYRREIQSFMLECGPDLAFNALQSGIIDKIVGFVAPRILGVAKRLRSAAMPGLNIWPTR